MENEEKIEREIEKERKYINIEKNISKKIMTREVNIEDEIDETATFGEHVSDNVAKFGGSWKFIISFMVIMFLWIVLNTIILKRKSFDPYPFILLNLALSCLAAVQAPIIMMSQNRQEIKDRKRSENDYKINIKAEMEVKLLHEKIDHLLKEQIKVREEINKLKK